MLRSVETATEVAKAGEAFVAALSEALSTSKASTSPEEFERFKRAVAIAIGTVEIELLWPIYRQHPDLEPPSLRGEMNGT